MIEGEVEEELGAAGFEEVSGESDVVKKMCDLVKPSREEVAAHELFHSPSAGKARTRPTRVAL
jgi:hypothetical protein